MKLWGRGKINRSKVAKAPLSGALLWLIAVAIAAVGGCETVSKGGGEDTAVQIRVVVTLRAPFYRSYPGDDSIPFVYLTEGTAVEWLKEKKSFSKVRLGNGSSGWVPSASLGEGNFGRSEDLAAPESLPSEGIVPGSGSAATRAAAGDETLNRFNRP